MYNPFRSLILILFTLCAVSAFNADQLLPRERSAALEARSEQASDTLSARQNVRIKKETNADRLARGLAPLKPKFRRSHLPGRAPHPVLGARVPQPSSMPHSGIIRVTRTDTGDFIGYVSNTYFGPTGAKRYYPVQDKSQALQVSFDSSSTPFAISTSNGPNSALPYLGLSAGQSFEQYIGPGSDDDAVFTSGALTTPNAPPGSAGNDYNPASDLESAVWSYNSATGALTATWVNPTGSNQATGGQLWYVAANFLFNLIGDPTDTFPSGGFPVTWTLVSA